MNSVIVYYNNTRMDFGCDGKLEIEPQLGGDYWVVSFARLITKIRKIGGNVAIDSSVISLMRNNTDMQFSYIAGMPYLTWKDGANIGHEQEYSDIILAGFCNVQDGNRTFYRERYDGGREVIIEIRHDHDEGGPVWRTEAYAPNGSCVDTGTHTSVEEAIQFFS